MYATELKDLDTTIKNDDSRGKGYFKKRMITVTFSSKNINYEEPIN